MATKAGETLDARPRGECGYAGGAAATIAGGTPEMAFAVVYLAAETIVLIVAVTPSESSTTTM